MKKGKVTIVASVIVTLMVAMAVGAGTMAWYSDTETSANNVFGGLTMNLLVDNAEDTGMRLWSDDPLQSLNDAFGGGEALQVSPGWYSGGGDQALKISIVNEGDLAGTASITFANVINRENGKIEPETDVLDLYPGAIGELGDAMQVRITYIDHSTGTPISDSSLGWISIDDLAGTHYAKVPLLATESITRLLEDDLTATPINWAQWQLEFWVPNDVGNEIMTDTLEFDMVFGLHQLEVQTP